MVKILGISFFIYALNIFGIAQAAVVPEYATNNYQNHELTRSEQKCLDEGYKITYANCSNQTAPADRCPDHDAYYRSCSQEQWCRNNNFGNLATDCKAPFYPHKMCDNKFPLYRACLENVDKACAEAGYTHKDNCQLTDKKCPFSADYGTCCDNCPDFSNEINNIPEGYIAMGDTCITCDGIVKTNVVPAPCEGFEDCSFGPMSANTPACLQGEKRLYSACKTAADVCRDKGYNASNCTEIEDSQSCPEEPAFKLCSINCLKLARSLYTNADILAESSTDPVIDLTKTELRSLVGMSNSQCQNLIRPEVTLHINSSNLEMYQHLFDRDISNLNFKLIFEEPLTLSAKGKFNNVKISASGNLSDCPLQAENLTVSGLVSFNGIPTLCTNIKINQDSKMLSSGSVKGNIEMERDSALGLKGSLYGSLKAKSYTEILIIGTLEFKDELNSDEDAESIVFGCNSKVKISGGIKADTSSLFLKQWTSLDTPSIKLISTSDNPELKNTLASIHMYKYVKLFSSYGDTVYPMAENNSSDCDDKHYLHLGSAADTAKQSLTIEPSNLIQDKWKCRSLSYKQQQCD